MRGLVAYLLPLIAWLLRHWVYSVSALAALAVFTLVIWYRKRIAAWFRALRARLGRCVYSLVPYLRSVVASGVFIVLVFAAALGVPKLAQLLARLISEAFSEPVSFPCDATTLSLIAGFSTAILMLLLPEKAKSFAAGVLARLSETARPDSETAEPVRFRPQKTDQFIALGNPAIPSFEDMPDGTDLTIVLRQVRAHEKYTIDGLLAQLAQVQKQIKHHNDKRDACCDGKREIAVKWVCFVSNNDRFHAYQPYSTFCFHIQVKKNTRYADILNKTDEKDFAAAIDEEIQLSSKFKLKDNTGTEREALVPDAIPDLDRFWIRDRLSNDQVVEILLHKNKNRAMIVKRCEKDGPIGVITALALLRHLLFEPLTKAGLHKAQVTDADQDCLFGEKPPGFKS